MKNLVLDLGPLSLFLYKVPQLIKIAMFSTLFTDHKQVYENTSPLIRISAPFFYMRKIWYWYVPRQVDEKRNKFSHLKRLYQRMSTNMITISKYLSREINVFVNKKRIKLADPSKHLATKPAVLYAISITALLKFATTRTRTSNPGSYAPRRY